MSTHLPKVLCYCVRAGRALGSGELVLVVSRPLRDAQDDAQMMQAVEAARIGPGRTQQDALRLGLAQDPRQRPQEHLGRDPQDLRLF